MVLALAVLATRVQSNIGLIRAGVSRGMSSRQIQSLITATGQAGIRRTDLLAGIRHVQGRVESGSRIMNTRVDRFPDPSRIAVAKGPMVSNFSYDIRFSAIDRRTGERKDHFLTVRSDRNLTPGEIISNAQELLAEAPLETETDQLSEGRNFTVVGARRKG